MKGRQERNKKEWKGDRKERKMYAMGIGREEKRLYGRQDRRKREWKDGSMEGRQDEKKRGWKRERN